MTRIARMKRIMIIGGPGSGKSTLAAALSKKLGLPVIHMDRIFWQSGWTPRPRAEMLRLSQAAAAQPDWIIDGNYSATWDLRAERAGLILCLDLPRHVRMAGLLWRTLAGYGRARADMADGCPERFDWEFMQWAWNYDRDTRPKMRDFAEGWGRTRRVEFLTSRAEVQKFLNRL